jgi:hypothetical protein
MDQERFDRITRTLALGQSRRGLLKGLTGTAIGGLLASVGMAEARAKGPCKAPNTKCGRGKNATCCTGSQVCNADGTCGPRDFCANVYCGVPDIHDCTVGVCDPYSGVCFPETNVGGECIRVDPNTNIGQVGTCSEFRVCVPNA